ncbi:MAG: endonuclease MutS2, partial [Clostridia bacterium]|nr:endonuclease MutS2 [Clostridia bacterium]
MQDKVLKTLEYDKIAEMLRVKTVTCGGEELAEALRPSGSFDEVKNSLALTAEAESMYIRIGRSPVESFPDMRECLKRIHAALFVSPGELMGIARCLRAARLAKDSIQREEGHAMLNNLAEYMSTHRSVEEEIDRCILGEEEIFDGASPELARIRRAMRQTNERVRERLGSMIRSATYSKYLQEPLITIRNGRFVIPVKQEYRQNVPGLIHDQSGSGATLFIEPAAVVELGNEYKKLLSQEQEEIERILAELTALVAPHSSEILENIRIMGELDLAFAKAKLAKDMRAVEPKLNDSG